MKSRIYENITSYKFRELIGLCDVTSEYVKQYMYYYLLFIFYVKVFTYGCFDAK